MKTLDLEQPLVEVSDNLMTEIETLLTRLEKSAVGKVLENPLEEFRQAKNLLNQAEKLGIDITQEQAKFTQVVAKYYDEQINNYLGKLEEKVNLAEPEAYLLMTHVAQLIDEAKSFGVDMPEEHSRLQLLEKENRNKIKI
jgi:hypothetical protein